MKSQNVIVCEVFELITSPSPSTHLTLCVFIVEQSGFSQLNQFLTKFSLNITQAKIKQPSSIQIKEYLLLPIS